MPLAFESKSHGTVAFGFFNIHVDMLLLDDLFFFAEPFCKAVIDVSRMNPEGKASASFDGWRIPDRRGIGNLHGAIAGTDLSGFIGETYRRFPFPERREDFKQRPHAEANRGFAEKAIGRFGKPEQVLIARNPASGEVSIAEFVFDLPGFEALIDYVDRGGYPRWKDDARPGYVSEMVSAVKRKPWAVGQRRETGNR